MHVRVAVIALQLVLTLQGADLLGTAQQAATPPTQNTPTVNGGRVVSTAAATGAATGAASTVDCQVTPGSRGGMLSSCPDVDSYAEFVNGLSAALGRVRSGFATSQLSVDSDPADASVSLDGLPAGNTPLNASVRAGTYLVRVTKDGYLAASTTVTVAAGKPGNVQLKLTPEDKQRGTSFWLHTADLAGAGDITNYVRDKDGNDWISFLAGGPGVAESINQAHSWAVTRRFDRDQVVVSLIPGANGGMSALVATLNSSYQDPGITYTALTLYDLVGGGATAVTVNSPAVAAPIYQASYAGVDVFLAYEDPRNLDPTARTLQAYILRSTDGGKTLNVGGSLTLPGNRNGVFQRAQLRIGPDGTRYIVDHESGNVYIIENGAGRLLGSVPAELKPDNYHYIDAQFDSAGNVHAVYITGPSQPAPAQITITYQFMPRKAVAYTSVALFTEPDCAACDRARAFLTKAGVSFSENPSQIDASVEASIASAITSDGYPVLARIGDDPAVSGNADIGTIGRLLGVTYTLPVATYAPRLSSQGIMDAPWAYLVVEDDEPRVVAERSEGIVVYSPAIGPWTWQKLWDVPPAPEDSLTSISPKPFPIFPGTRVTELDQMTDVKPMDIPFNQVDSVNALSFFYTSEAFSPGNVPQLGFTFHSIRKIDSNSYRAVAQVSQLIPSASFDIDLGEKGQPSAVAGELAPYVTKQGLVTDGGRRLYHVVVDLRAQNETAVNGSIQARTLGGYVNVDVETAGESDTRQVSLILLVQNSRLRAVDPNTPDAARDITDEAVHFSGPADHWVVTNNTALPNSIPCGPDQALLLDPNAVATFDAAVVKSFELGSCLSALEVEPTVITGCQSWNDAKLILAAQTIDSLAQSLPLMRSASGTNYELTFGSTDAVVHRIVSLDKAPAPGGGPRCVSDVDDTTAALVEISGSILGHGEAYAPTIKIVEQGTAAVATSATALPDSIAWERQWLELESSFLEQTLRLPEDDAALVDVINFSWKDKQTQYRRELLATRALLHCNYQGRDIAAVRDLIDRVKTIPDAVLGPALCLQDFILRPWEYWPTFNTSDFGDYAVSFLSSVINRSLSSNPTLAFLVTNASADPADYGAFLLKRAQGLETQSASSLRGLALDFALDHYARILTATAGGMRGVRGALTKAVLLAGPVERDAMRGVLACAQSFGSPNPFPDLMQLTSKQAYTAGIPCIDSKPTSQAKIDAYRRLAIGLRSGLFGGLFDAAGRDLNLLFGYLDALTKILDQVTATEARYPAGTQLSTWTPALPALDRFVIVRRHIEALLQERGRKISWGEASKVLSGFVECGVGVVKGLFSGQGLLLLGLGVGAVLAGPAAAAVSGIVFVASGVAFTGMAAYSLNQAWEALDLKGKTAGVCGTVVSALLTASAWAPTRGAFARWNASELRSAPPQVIDQSTLPTQGGATALDLAEQANALSGRDGTVSVAEPPAAPPLDPLVQALVSALPEAKRSVVASVADDLGFAQMGTDARAVFEDLCRTYGQDNGLAAALHRRQQQIQSLVSAGKTLASPDLAAWIQTGADFIASLMPGRPKSLSIEPTATEPVGQDADLVRAVAGDLDFAGMKDLGGVRGGDAALQASTSVTQALLRSDRLLDTFNAGKPGEALYTPEEANFLATLGGDAQPSLSRALMAELAKPQLADALRQGFEAAESIAGVPAAAEVTAVDGSFLANGAFKSVFLVKVSVKGATEPISFVVKTGEYTQPEFDLLVKLGDPGVGLTQRPLIKSLLKNFNGQEALSVEEFVAGKNAYEVSEPSIISGHPDLALSSALGKFDALMYLRTADGSGSGYYNADLHLGNLIVEATGALKAIDVDPRFGHTVSADVYVAASLLRRRVFVHPDLKFSAPDFGSYLDGLAATLRAELGDAPTKATLTAAGKILADPQQLAQATAIQERSGVLKTDVDYGQNPDFAADVTALVTALDAFIQSH